MPKELNYLKLANKYVGLIEAGALSIGEKMPSIRTLMSTEQISLATATHAYEILVDRGLIESRPQSGYYVTYTRPNIIDKCCEYTVKKTAVKVQLSEIIYKMINAAGSPKMLNMGAGVVDPDLLPNSTINRIVRKILKEENNHSAEYIFPPGLLDYRKQVQKKLDLNKIKVSVDNIISTQGCMEALHLSLKVLTKPGDTVLIETPSYYGTLQAMQSFDLKVIEIPNHPKTGIDPKYIKEIFEKNSNIKTAIFISNFSNPLGTKISDENKKLISELFLKHNVPIIEDNIYGDLGFDKSRLTTMKSFTPENVFYCSSLSKSVSPGIRAGHLVLPSKYKEEVERQQFISTVATSNLSQLIASELLKGKFYEEHCRKLTQELKANILKFQKHINLHFPEGTKVSCPEGGFFLWIELPREIDSVDLYNLMIKKDIIIAPGVIFSASGDYKNYIRLNTGLKWNERIEKSIKLIGETAKKLIGK